MLITTTMCALILSNYALRITNNSIKTAFIRLLLNSRSDMQFAVIQLFGEEPLKITEIVLI